MKEITERQNTSPVQKSAEEIMKQHGLTKANYAAREGSPFTVENILAAMEEYKNQSVQSLKSQVQCLETGIAAALLHNAKNNELVQEQKEHAKQSKNASVQKESSPAEKQGYWEFEARRQHKVAVENHEAVKELTEMNNSLKEVIADNQRLTREIDVFLFGEQGAAKNPSLCDVFKSIQSEVRRLRESSPGLQWVKAMEKLLKEDFRLESADDMIYLSIIDRKVYPRVWQDSATDNRPEIIAESEENILQRNSPLAEKDWIIRWEGETLSECLQQYEAWLSSIEQEGGEV